MDNTGWLIYIGVVLLVSGFVGRHLGGFRKAYTEMTGMMAGMTMGMLNGFLLGYAAGAASNSMFWGNMIGVILGLSLGAYFGRAGGLMGVMDGAMGGVMGGSMGAMLAVMVAFPSDGQFWTAVLLSLVYVAGMIGLVVLIEQSAPQHAALHRLMPMFTRAVAVEAAEYAEYREAREIGSRTQNKRRVTAVGANAMKGKEVAANVKGAASQSRRGPDGERAERPVQAKEPTSRTGGAVRVHKSRNARPVRKQAPQGRGRGPLIGGVAALILLGVIVAWLLGQAAGSGSDSGSVVGPTPAASGASSVSAEIEASAVVAPVGADGKQTLDVVLDSATFQYIPKAIKVKQGIPVHFNLSVINGDPG